MYKGDIGSEKRYFKEKILKKCGYGKENSVFGKAGKAGKA